jgi:acyl dehydratase
VSLSPKLRQLIGQSSEPRRFEIEKGQIRRFATAVGETDPIHFDEEAAKAAGFRSLVAPPTFPAALIPPEAFMEELGWDLQSLMHRAEEYEYFKPICAGDELTVTQRVSDIYDQPGAGDTSLIFAIIESRATDRRDAPVFKGRRVLVKLLS